MLPKFRMGLTMSINPTQNLSQKCPETCLLGGNRSCPLDNISHQKGCSWLCSVVTHSQWCLSHWTVKLLWSQAEQTLESQSLVAITAYPPLTASCTLLHGLCPSLHSTLVKWGLKISIKDFMRIMWATVHLTRHQPHGHSRVRILLSLESLVASCICQYSS